MSESCRIVAEVLEGIKKIVAPDITTKEQAEIALIAAREYGRNVICEKFITGFDFRLLVINYKFICAALRTPASVTGDGGHSIQWLIDETNMDPRRGYGHEKVLTQIKFDGFTKKMLDDAGYTLDSVPPKGELVLLKPTANLSTGGTSTSKGTAASMFMFAFNCNTACTVFPLAVI